MSPTAGNGSSKPQTWSARIMGAFTGPATARGSEATRDPSRDHPSRGAQGGDVHPEPAGGQMVPGGAGAGHRCRHRHPCATSSPRTKSPRRGRTPSPSLPTPNCSGPSSWSSAPSDSCPCGKRKRTLLTFAFFLIGFAFTHLPRTDRIRLHPPRRLAHAAGLAHQQIRDHEHQGDRQGGRGAAPGPGSEGRRTFDIQGDLEPGRPEATDRQQALHAEGTASEEDPESRPSKGQRHRAGPSGVSQRPRSGAPTAAAGVRRSGGAPASEPWAPLPAPAAPRLP